MDARQKYFYTIGDICKMTGTKPHILRYWESKFKLLRPARRYSGHRKYTLQDIDIINRIRYLVIDRKFTLTGAKKEIARQLNTKPTTGAPEAPSASHAATLREIKKDIEECLSLLEPETKQQELIKL